MDMILVALHMIVEALMDVALMLTFPLTVLGTVAAWTSGPVSIICWTLFYGLILWVTGCLAYHGTWHVLKLRMPVIHYKDC